MTPKLPCDGPSIELWACLDESSWCSHQMVRVQGPSHGLWLLGGKSHRAAAKFRAWGDDGGLGDW